MALWALSSVVGLSSLKSSPERGRQWCRAIPRAIILGGIAIGDGLDGISRYLRIPNYAKRRG